MINSPNPAHRLGSFVPPDSSSGASSGNSPEILRVLAVGSLKAIDQHVMRMYQLGYAQPHEWSRPLPTVNPNEWSRPLPTVNPNEVMRILTKRLVGLND